jgi:polysaccharide export outer membrane protein
MQTGYRFRNCAMIVTLLFSLFAVAQQAATTSTADDKKPASTANDGTAPSAKADTADKTVSTAKGTMVNDPDFVIGTEDVIAINVWHETEMSRAMAVRPDGKISMPLIGEVEAEGKTPAQLQVELTKRLQTLIKNPDVTVIVQEIRSQKFNILGEVQRPGMYPLTKPMTILDALAVAGGFRDFAKPKKMYILRKSKDGTSAKIAVNYNNVIKGADKNVELESRDTIVVP